MRIAFAGDRDVAVSVLDYLMRVGVQPLALLVSGDDRASHAAALTDRCRHLSPDRVFAGTAFRSPSAIAALRALDLDFIIGIHFPYVVPPDVLSVPRQGMLNLHPALLPYNRGWHTPSWAILEDTPAGATLHFMSEELDAGDIVHQRELAIAPDDTANTLYRRLKELELQVFTEAWPSLAGGTFRRTPQDTGCGTSHSRQDLFSDAVQRLDLNAQVTAGDLLRRLRALTTNRTDEACYFVRDGVRYRVQVQITREDSGAARR